MTITKRRNKHLIATIGIIGCIILCLLTGTACGEDIAAFTKVGDYVTFGTYEQDNDPSNGQEPIEWLVLDYDEATQEALLISRYGLDAQPYHDGYYYPTWANSDIRKWLNDEFLNTAFTASEQTAIAETEISTPHYNGYDGGADTIDRIFLLSRQEAAQYFVNEEARKATPTAYALAQCAWQSDTHTLDGIGCCCWLLRSPGESSVGANIVHYNGGLSTFYDVYYVHNYEAAIRPALKLHLNIISNNDFFSASIAEEESNAVNDEVSNPVDGIELAAFKAVGSYVTYGTYEQDNNLDNGQEPIEWLVLNYDEAAQEVWLISRYGLDAWLYHYDTPYPTWADSEIREWLNGDFMKAAFTTDEQTAIVKTNISTPDYKRMDGGLDTTDHIFLLSRQEANQLFPNANARKTTPTEYAVARGALQYNEDNKVYLLNDIGCCTWWLRSPGYDEEYATYVYYDGGLRRLMVFNETVAIRPAFKLNLNVISGKAEELPQGEQHPQAADLINEEEIEPYTKVGGYVTFGTYEQDRNKGNGKEPIEWLVLDYDEETQAALLISRYGLDARVFSGLNYPEWSRSDIRNWLNDEFLSTAFTDNEQAAILETLVSTPDYNGISGGIDTTDRIYLLSREEADLYFENDETRQTTPTAYAIAQGVKESDRFLFGVDSYCLWWLRSPGSVSYGASCVGYGGGLSDCTVFHTAAAVRPVFRLDLYALGKDTQETPAPVPDETEEVNYTVKDEKTNASVIEEVYFPTNSAMNIPVNEEELASFQNLGGYVLFGAYEQDNDPANGQEPIEWLVLDYDKATQEVLLISRHGLDARVFHHSDNFPTWAKSNIRQWLNNEFLNNAFNAYERSAIAETNLTTDDYYNCDGGADTVDRIFLLSREEARAYLLDQGLSLKATPTDYAVAQGIYHHRKKYDSLGSDYWWLRSPGDYLYVAALVAPEGYISACLRPNLVDVAVRPALKLNLNILGSVGESPKTNIPATYEELAPMVQIGQYQYVTYGAYEQDNNIDNGKEPIEWLVLNYDEATQKVLLVSRYGLDAKAYHGLGFPTWEKSDIRAWLNSEFLNAAFTADEQIAITETMLSTPDYCGNNGGVDTADRIFLLSREDTMKYFLREAACMASPTKYAVAQGAWQSDYCFVDNVGSCWWWLRSPGDIDSTASGIGYDGLLDYNHAGIIYLSVRPALVLDLNAL